MTRNTGRCSRMFFTSQGPKSGSPNFFSGVRFKFLLGSDQNKIGFACELPQVHKALVDLTVLASGSTYVLLFKTTR